MEAREKADDSALGGLWISNEKRLTDVKFEMQFDRIAYHRVHISA